MLRRSLAVARSVLAVARSVLAVGQGVLAVVRGVLAVARVRKTLLPHVASGAVATRLPIAG